MMTEARMVLLDEPGAGVNRTLLGKLSDAIERLNRERGYTFCIIEHDMDLIARLCNPVVVMARGTGDRRGNHGCHPDQTPRCARPYLGQRGHTAKERSRAMTLLLDMQDPLRRLRRQRYPGGRLAHRRAGRNRGHRRPQRRR